MPPPLPPALAFDARDLLVPQRTGVEWVAWQLLEHLPRELGGVRRALVFDREPLPPAVLELAQRGGYEVWVLPPRWPNAQRGADLWMAWQVGPQLRDAGFDLLLSVNTKIPLRGLKAVATVHGVEWAMVPADYPLAERIKQRVWLWLAAVRAQALLTFSETTRADVERLLPPRRQPVVVIPEGVMPHLRPLAAGELDHGLPRRLGLQRPFVLSVCTLAPRKNIDGLLVAWARLKSRRAGQGEAMTHQLALVGRAGAASQTLAAQVQALGLQDDVVFTGYVGDEQLVQLYHLADVFAYPSRYEGFGLPPLEAMRCGTPVLTSRRGATAEVAGDAAWLVDPTDTDAIADGLTRLLQDPALRARLAHAGRLRAAAFTWPAFASRLAPFLLSCISPTQLEPCHGP